ncbi:MAG: MATE family efflux transporter [Tenericutes bacterium]|jgi:putative MATE family efflux protein|nr:MATE family efflux transporter [Mycoplasmatota bacterium]
MDQTLNKKNDEMLRHMSIKKLLITLAIPSILAMIVNALYNLVDTLFVSMAVGTDAIGALTIAYPVQLIILAIGLMLGVGSASVFSRAFGRRDLETMKKAVNTAIVLNVLLTLTVSLITYIFLEDLLIFFGATEGNIDYARDYILIILIALIPFSLGVMMNNLTRAEGRVRIAMWSLVIGAGFNIALDPIFIFDWGLGLGVQGAAYATAIAKTSAFIYIFAQALSKKSSLAIDLKHIYKIDLKAAKEMLLVGLPSFARIAMGSVMIIVVNNLIKNYASTVDIATMTTEDIATMYQSIYGVINRLLRFALMPGFGLVQGMVPIIGYNFGAKKFGRVHEVMSFASKLLLAYFTFALIMIMFFSPALFSIFTKGDEAENIEQFINLGSSAFRIVALGFSFITYQVILSSGYQAMGYPLRAFIVALSRRFILFIPFAYLLTHYMGIDGIWWTFVVADFVTGILSYIVYKIEMKQLKTRIVRI